jgi:hypothetical protein
MRYTKEELNSKSKLCKTRTEFKMKFRTYYQEAIKQGIMDEICSHMPKQRQSRKKWKKDEALKEVLKFKTKSELFEKEKGLYGAIKRMGLEEIAFAHMKDTSTILSENQTYWNKERCHEVALKYKGRYDFQVNERGAYGSALRQGFLDEICNHMDENLTLRERKYQDKLFRKLKIKYPNIKIYQEYSIKIKNRKARLDIFIEADNINIPIEIKHDKSYHYPKEIEEQINKYNNYFKDKHDTIDVILMSPKGKYGISERELLSKLDNLII